MSEIDDNLKLCDICLKSEVDFFLEKKDTKIELNEEGLWVCTDCQISLNAISIFQKLISKRQIMHLRLINKYPA